MRRATCGGQLAGHLVLVLLAAAGAGGDEGGGRVAVVRRLRVRRRRLRDGDGDGRRGRQEGGRARARTAAAAAVVPVERHGIVLHVVLRVAADLVVAGPRRPVDGDDVRLGAGLPLLNGLNGQLRAAAHQLVGPLVVAVLGGHDGGGRPQRAGGGASGGEAGEVGGGGRHLLAAAGDGVAAGVVALAPDQVGQDPPAGVDEPVAHLMLDKRLRT